MNGDPQNKRGWSQNRLWGYEYFRREIGRITPETVIVDIGAGKGQYGDLLRQGSYIGVDFVQFPGVDVVTDIVAGIPLSSEIADIVVLSNVLEHVPDPKAVLAHCYRILKPGGKIVILVPFFISIHQEPHDYLRYTHYMLRYLLSHAGFVDVVVEPSGNVIDVMQKVQTGFFRTAKASVRQRFRRNLAVKACGYASVALLRWCARGIFLVARTMTNPNLRTGKDWYAEGYGAVAHKKVESRK
ncbi:MAG: class I SAM-dependent methyltransferase [bacterium]|nr:class I SAM-dependent methyltransferase [bacterium]MDZ4285095.1 class I SAM-dependent methyltransferase [Patescibacteria group bacterium]